VTSDQIQDWLDAYVAAWRSYDHAAIGALFSDDASYRYYPHSEPLRGREAIVASWLEEPDEPGSWQASYAPLMIDGERAIATGETSYATGRRFSNMFVMRFDGASRCSEFVEWFIEQPADLDARRATA
jgi:hypothetical protein